MNADPEQTKASMERIAGILAQEKATLWINHDKAQRDRLRWRRDFTVRHAGGWTRAGHRAGTACAPSTVGVQTRACVGQRAEAQKLLAPVLQLVPEGFDTADLQEAKALLEELGG